MNENKKQSLWQRILSKFSKKEKTKMLVSGLDKEVEEIVNLLNENGMKPFASCDGTIKGHMDGELKDEHDVSLGYISMMDSDKVRDFFAILQNDDSYNLSITSQSDIELYGNKVHGLRYGIYFDNLKGGKVEELTQILKLYLAGEITPTKENRARIDEISRLVNLNKDDNMIVTYHIHELFRLHNIESVDENYSVKFQQIDMRKDLRPLREHSIPGEEQNLHVELEQISYRTSGFAQSLKVLEGMYDLYEMMPDIDEKMRKAIIQEEFDDSRATTDGIDHSPMFVETQAFWQTIKDNADKCINEVNEERINKSIARHERKMSKMQKTSKNRKTGVKIEDIEM